MVKRRFQSDIHSSYILALQIIKKAFLLFIFAGGIIFLSSLLLDITEGGDLPHYQVRGQFLEILFETVSAFSTVGLSTGLTGKLSTTGKWILIVLMFVGRLGPLTLAYGLVRRSRTRRVRLPQARLMIG